MSNSKSSGGIGFTSLLLLTFIILKLTRTIDWSWWWVLSPLWIPICLAGLCLAIYGAIAMFEHKKPPKSKWQVKLEEIQADARAKKQSTSA